MRLSHSQMETLHQCPQRHYLTKIRKVRQSPGSALIIGIAVHAACEADNRAVLEGRGRIAYAALLDMAMGTLQGECAAQDPDNLLDRGAMTWQVTATLAIYCALVAPKIFPVAVEENFQFSVTNEVEFTGRIDLITEHDGVRTVVDFKTAQKPWQPGIEHTKSQATAYLLGAERRGTPAQRVTFITFPVQPDGGVGLDVRPTMRTADDLMEYHCQIAESAARLQVMTERQWFPAKATPLCAWCGVLGHCPTGQAWLKAHGRTPAVPVIEPAED